MPDGYAGGLQKKGDLPLNLAMSIKWSGGNRWYYVFHLFECKPDVNNAALKTFPPKLFYEVWNAFNMFIRPQGYTHTVFVEKMKQVV